MEHALLGCEWSTCVWFGFSGLSMEDDVYSTIDEWLNKLILAYPLKHKDSTALWHKIAYTLSYIWKGRNKAIF